MTKLQREILLSQRFLPEVGGSIRWFFELFRRWDTEIEVICDDYAKNPVAEPLLGAQSGDRLRVCRAPVLQDDWGFDSLVNCCKSLRMMFLAVVRSRHSKRVFCARIIPEGLVAVFTRLFLPGKRACIAFVHGEEILACESSRQLRFLLKVVAKRIDLCIANSQNTARLLAPYADAHRIEVLPPGVDSRRFAPLGSEEKRRLRQELGFSEDGFYLLTLARLESRKNQKAVLSALVKLQLDFPQLHYLIAGEGADRARLEAEIAREQIGHKVHLLGAVSDELRLQLFQAADLFVMPSIQSSADTEGFGIVFIEAAACGLPSIAGNVGGQSEAVRNSETGLVIDGNSREELEEAISFFLENPKARVGFGATAVDFAKQYDWMESKNRLVKILEERGL